MSEYHIDAQDRLVFFDDTWSEFAKDNGAPELANVSIINQSLWNFISNMEVVHLYQILLQKVRQSHKPLELYYRCDGPHARRFFQMNIEVNKDHIVRFCNWQIHKESREPILLFDVMAERSEETAGTTKIGDKGSHCLV